MIEIEPIREMVSDMTVNEAVLASLVPDLLTEIEILRTKLAEAEYEAEAAHQ